MTYYIYIYCHQNILTIIKLVNFQFILEKKIKGSHCLEQTEMTLVMTKQTEMTIVSERM